MVARNYLVLSPCLIDPLAAFDTDSSFGVHDAVLSCFYDYLFLIFFISPSPAGPIHVGEP